MKTEYLLHREVEHVLAALTPSNRLICRVCLHTGLRLGDVLTLRTQQLGRQFMVTEAKTKKRRRVGLTDELLAQVREKDAHLEAAYADIGGLREQCAQMSQKASDAEEARIAARLQCQKAEAERDKAETRAQEAEKQLEGARQVTEAAKLRGDKLKAENDALKKQPITAVVDKEEVERQAREMAAEMTADLRAQLEQAASGSEQDAHSSYDNVLLADRSFQNIGKMVVPSLRRLPPEQREQLTTMLVHTLGQIQGEVSRCL